MCLDYKILISIDQNFIYKTLGMKDLEIFCCSKYLKTPHNNFLKSVRTSFANTFLPYITPNQFVLINSALIAISPILSDKFHKNLMFFRDTSYNKKFWMFFFFFVNYSSFKVQVAGISIWYSSQHEVPFFEIAFLS